MFENIGEQMSGAWDTANTAITNFGEKLVPGGTDLKNLAVLANLGKRLLATNVIGPSGNVNTIQNPVASGLSDFLGGSVMAQEAQRKTTPAEPVQPTKPDLVRKAINAVLDVPPEGYIKADPGLAPSNTIGTLKDQPIIQSNSNIAPNFISRPSQGSVDNATSTESIDQVASNTVPVSSVVSNLAGGDPIAMGAIVAAFGPDVALKLYDIAHNNKLAESAGIKASADMIQAQSDVPYKRAQAIHAAAQVRKIDRENDPNFAGQKKLFETTGDLMAQRIDRQNRLEDYLKTPLSKMPVDRYLATLVPGAKTIGDVASTVGVENLEKILGHISSMRNTDKNAEAVIGAAKLKKEGDIDTANINRMGVVAGELTATGNSIRSELAKARGNFQIPLTGTEEEKAAHTAYIGVLEKMASENDAKLAAVQQPIVELGNQSAEKRGANSSRRRPEAGKKVAAPESAKASEASAYGVPPTIPKGTGIPQEYKGKTIYILKGAAYDADGNFIAVLTDKSKKK
jgi:hypothetical protein